jgi:hypothetical protein
VARLPAPYFKYLSYFHVFFFLYMHFYRIPTKGTYVYTPGHHSCEVPSKPYPSLCASDELSSNQDTTPCADENFSSKYKLLCSRLSPTWFCDGIKISPKFNPIQHISAFICSRQSGQVGQGIRGST